MDNAPLILTLKLDPDSFGRFDGLRRRYFPSERNFLPAHVTLFHHLPGSQLETVKGDLKRIARDTDAMPVSVAAVKSIGKGCAYMLRSRELDDLRDRLASLWSEWLIPQDRQGFRAHVTVQNKVTPQEAKDTLKALERDFFPFTAEGQGLLLWRYLGGPWEALGDYRFRG